MALGLGIDFEHIYHTPAYRSLETSPEIPIDLEGVTTRLLQLLDEHDARATFFVVSDLAEESPSIVERIASAGHEIASHTVSHPSLPSLQTRELLAEVRESKATLERISGATVSGFRAPTFQIDDRVYGALAEAGYSYSSSVMPSVPIPGFYSDRYGFEEPVDVVTGGGQVAEYPVAVSPTVSLPVSGAWTRLLGRRFTVRSVKRLLARNEPVLTYVHPWEFTGLQNTRLPFRNRVRTGDWMFETYEQLLGLDAKVVTLGELAAAKSPEIEHRIEQTGSAYST